MPAAALDPEYRIPWNATLAWGLPLLALSSLTANPGVTAMAIGSLMLIVLLVWRRGEVPILPFVCAFQWLQAAAMVLQADATGVDLRTMSWARSIELATIYSLLWPLSLALGMRVMLASRPRFSMPAKAPAFTPLLKLYFLWLIFDQVVVRFDTGSIKQITIALSCLRWGVVFAILTEAARDRTKLPIAAGVLAFELALGFLSFFSDFKTPLFVLIIVLLNSRIRLSLRQSVAGVAVLAFTLYLAVIWSAIKPEYRDTISGNTGKQVVTVDADDQFAELARLFGTIDAAVLADGWGRLVERVAYTEYFAYAIDFIPTVRPHEEGALLMGALEHVLMPRVFFPYKAPLESDTVITERYTGLSLINTARESSISLGTPADSYIDFGAPLMFLPAFVFGMFGAWLLAWSHRVALGTLDVGFAVSILLQVATLERSNIKLIGGTLTCLIVLLGIRPLLRGPLGMAEAPAPRAQGALRQQI